MAHAMAAGKRESLFGNGLRFRTIILSNVNFGPQTMKEHLLEGW